MYCCVLVYNIITKLVKIFATGISITIFNTVGVSKNNTSVKKHEIEKEIDEAHKIFKGLKVRLEVQLTQFLILSFLLSCYLILYLYYCRDFTCI